MEVSSSYDVVDTVAAQEKEVHETSRAQWSQEDVTEHVSGLVVADKFRKEVHHDQDQVKHTFIESVQ